MNVEGRAVEAARPSTVERVAPAVFVVLWSTGFVVARYGTRDAGPLTFLTMRTAIAAGVLLVVAAAIRSPRIDRRGAAWMAVSSIGIHVLYLGGVFVAIDLGMPSGVSALIAGLHPVVTSIAGRFVLGEHLRRVQWFGVLLGLVGVVAVVVDRTSAGTTGLGGAALLAAGLAVVGMSAGSLVQRKHGTHVPLLFATAVQYVTATVVFLVGAIVFERWEITWTAQTSFALLWAVVVLSIGAILLMLLLLQRQAASKVSSLFFLTPALSTIEGAVLFDERLGALALVGLLVAVVGVALVTRQER